MGWNRGNVRKINAPTCRVWLVSGLAALWPYGAGMLNLAERGRQLHVIGSAGRISAIAELGSTSVGVIQGGLDGRTQVSKDGFDMGQNMGSNSDSCWKSRASIFLN